MSRASLGNLSRRERQIMDVIYQLGRASVAEVLAGLAEPPGYSAVRAFLGILEEKGYLRHEKVGAKYIYLPTHPRQSAGKAALQRVVQTFFDNSVEETVAALLDVADDQLSPQEIERLAQLIDQARKDGR